MRIRSRMKEYSPSWAFRGTGDYSRNCLSTEANSVAQQQKHTGARTMADRNALSLVGFIFSGIAATVILVAYLVVRDHVEGRLLLDSRRLSVPSRAMAASGNAVAATTSVAATAVR